MATNPLSLQMYTLRDLASVDYVGTLKKVKEIGYGAVEVAGVWQHGALQNCAANSTQSG
jgi:hypothetical protein